MPWKECTRVEERLRFVARILEGEQMAAVCREFGISRKTGYKIFNRYKDCGLEGLNDQSRRPHRSSNRIAFQLMQGIDRQADILLDNTRRFARGLPANNALLWGARGTGKSSLVHAVLNDFADDGLRLVEVRKEELAAGRIGATLQIGSACRHFHSARIGRESTDGAFS